MTFTIGTDSTYNSFTTRFGTSFYGLFITWSDGTDTSGGAALNAAMRANWYAAPQKAGDTTGGDCADCVYDTGTGASFPLNVPSAFQMGFMVASNIANCDPVANAPCADGMLGTVDMDVADTGAGTHYSFTGAAWSTTEPYDLHGNTVDITS